MESGARPLSFSLVLTVLVSIVLHVGVILFSPAVPLAPARAGLSDAMEVELVSREVPIPDALLPKPLPEIPLPEPLDLRGLPGGTAAARRKLGLAVKPGLGARGPVELPGVRPLPAPPAVDMPPPALAPGDAPPVEAPPESGALGEVILRAQRPAESQGLKGGRGRPLPGDGADGRMLDALAYGPRARRRAAIQGPAASRRIVFRPKKPRLRGLEEAAEIVLKFWVLPDGTVGRVVPIRKASARLEGLAANHLKRWRFSPLPRGAEAVEQWGEVTFRFRLR